MQGRAVKRSLNLWWDPDRTKLSPPNAAILGSHTSCGQIGHLVIVHSGARSGGPYQVTMTPEHVAEILDQRLLSLIDAQSVACSWSAAASRKNSFAQRRGQARMRFLGIRSLGLYQVYSTPPDGEPQ